MNESDRLLQAAEIVSTGNWELDIALSAYLNFMAERVASGNGIPAMRGLGMEHALAIADALVIDRYVGSE